ncbi:MAG: hypothetical protein ACWGQW_25305 [bacterium]
MVMLPEFLSRDDMDQNEKDVLRAVFSRFVDRIEVDAEHGVVGLTLKTPR